MIRSTALLSAELANLVGCQTTMADRIGTVYNSSTSIKSVTNRMISNIVLYSKKYHCISHTTTYLQVYPSKIKRFAIQQTAANKQLRLLRSIYQVDHLPFNLAIALKRHAYSQTPKSYELNFSHSNENIVKDILVNQDGIEDMYLSAIGYIAATSTTTSDTE